jgi:hypothetical protein
MPVKVKTAVESRKCAFYRMGQGWNWKSSHNIEAMADTSSITMVSSPTTTTTTITTNKTATPARKSAAAPRKRLSVAMMLSPVSKKANNKKRRRTEESPSFQSPPMKKHFKSTASSVTAPSNPHKKPEALKDKVKKYDEVRTISNAFENKVNKTTLLGKHIQKREEKAEGDFTSLKQAKDEAYHQYEALRAKKNRNEHRIQFFLRKIDKLRAMNMEFTEEQDSHEGVAFRHEALNNAQKAWEDWKVQLEKAKKAEKKAKAELVSLQLHLHDSAYYQDWSGQQLFADLNLEFKYKTLNTLSKKELQTLRKAMQVLGFSVARDWKLGTKSRPDIIDEISAASLGMPTTELMVDDESDDIARARWEALQRQALLGGGSDFDGTAAMVRMAVMMPWMILMVWMTIFWTLAPSPKRSRWRHRIPARRLGTDKLAYLGSGEALSQVQVGDVPMFWKCRFCFVALRVPGGQTGCYTQSNVGDF